MNKLVRFMAWFGVAGAILVTLGSVHMSIKGIRDLIGVGDHSFTASMAPIMVALLALSFNGLSPWLFKMFKDKGVGGFATGATFCLWIAFVSYDAISNISGLLSTFSGIRVSDFDSGERATERLGGSASFVIMLLATLFTFGPFLIGIFGELVLPANESQEPERRKP